MFFDHIQFVEQSVWNVEWCFAEFEVTFCLLSRIVYSVWPHSFVRSYPAPETQIVAESIQRYHRFGTPVCKIVQVVHSGISPVPNSGRPVKHTFTSTLKYFTNTHSVIDLSMLSRLSRSFSCLISHLCAAAKPFIQGDPLFCL